MNTVAPIQPPFEQAAHQAGEHRQRRDPSRWDCMALLCPNKTVAVEIVLTASQAGAVLQTKHIRLFPVSNTQGGGLNIVFAGLGFHCYLMAGTGLEHGTPLECLELRLLDSQFGTIEVFELAIDPNLLGWMRGEALSADTSLGGERIILA